MKNIKVFTNEKYDVRGFTGYDSETDSIIISFRGAVFGLNWFLCIDFFLIDASEYCYGCKAHRGILKSYYSIKQNII